MDVRVDTFLAVSLSALRTVCDQIVDHLQERESGHGSQQRAQGPQQPVTEREHNTDEIESTSFHLYMCERATTQSSMF